MKPPIFFFWANPLPHIFFPIFFFLLAHLNVDKLWLFFDFFSILSGCDAGRGSVRCPVPISADVAAGVADNTIYKETRSGIVCIYLLESVSIGTVRAATTKKERSRVLVSNFFSPHKHTEMKSFVSV